MLVHLTSYFSEGPAVFLEDHEGVSSGGQKVGWGVGNRPPRVNVACLFSSTCCSAPDSSPPHSGGTHRLGAVTSNFLQLPQNPGNPPRGALGQVSLEVTQSV